MENDSDSVQKARHRSAVAKRLASVIIFVIGVGVAAEVVTLFHIGHVVSVSMESTLTDGDRVLYGPIGNGGESNPIHLGSFFQFPLNSFAQPLQRGDVISFQSDHGDYTHYVKRVIGLPGDQVRIADGRVYINGDLVPQSRTDPFIEATGDRVRKLDRYVETLPNGATYEVLDQTSYGLFDNAGSFDVPDKHYFVMGDNRDNSTDSRSAVGFVPLEAIVGRLIIILWSAKRDQSDDKNGASLLSRLRLERTLLVAR